MTVSLRWDQEVPEPWEHIGCHAANHRAVDQHISTTYNNDVTMHSWVRHRPLGVGVSALLRCGQFPRRVGFEMEHLPVRVIRVELVAFTSALVKEILRGLNRRNILNACRCISGNSKGHIRQHTDPEMPFADVNRFEIRFFSCFSNSECRWW